MKKLLLFSLVNLGLVQLSFPQSFPPDYDSYHIVSAIGNKYLTVKDANVDNGALLEIRDFLGTDLKLPSPNQVWTLQEFGFDHNYFIKSRQGKIIDLKYKGADEVQMWSSWHTPNQRWQLIDAGGGYFYIKNGESGKVLDVSGGVNENGRKVWSYQKNNSVSQKWKFVKNSGPSNGYLITGEPTFCEKEISFKVNEIDIKTAVIPICPQKQDEWDFITTHQFGISAKNRGNHNIGWSAAGKEFGPKSIGGNWYPIADMKKVHIGKLCKVGYFDAVKQTAWPKSWFADRDERDFNLHVIPSSPFSYQIEKSIIRYSPNINITETPEVDCIDNWLKCGSTLVMEGEITPDEEFIDYPSNPWLGSNGTSSLFLNQNVGMYGPWVNEKIHCNHPEIHPVEMLWGETADPRVKYLCLLQDDSDRFGYYSNFPDYEDASDKVEAMKKVFPWAKAPLSGQFFVAFQIDPASAAKQSYTIEIKTSREVITGTSDSYIPASEYAGKTRVIKNNGVELFKVTELQTNENDIGLRFELFKKKDSNIILGYMVISAAVSKDIDGKEGFMVIKLTKSN